MSLTPKQATGARRVTIQPGGAALIQERIYFQQGGRHLAQDDVRDAVLIVAPADDLDAVSVFGFRSQDAVAGLQTGAGWDVDGVGFNFTYTIPPDTFPDRGRRYKVEFILTVLGNTPDVSSHELRSTYSITGGSGLW